jgi:hypothetical protein
VSADRGELIERRRLLRERLDRGRRREESRHAIADVVAELVVAGVDHRLIWPDDPGDVAWSWIERRFPLGFARVEWSGVPGAECRPWSSDAERDRIFAEMLGERASGEERIVIVWGNAARPSLELSAAAARAHCTLLLDADFDLWAYAPGEDWLIECYHENEHRAGSAPG